ncbi:MAG: hypothetical protein GF311_04840 [Candidatus Lokiarchaeota archaeon]|nr:hypothetical protein [Candidatus Lokiarchaeota archaeon]
MSIKTLVFKALEDIELEKEECYFLMRFAITKLRNMEHCDPRIQIIDHLLRQIEIEKNIID